MKNQPENGSEDEEVSGEGDDDENGVENDEDEVPRFVEAPVELVESHQIVIDRQIRI